jgi:hypothetical protein
MTNLISADAPEFPVERKPRRQIIPAEAEPDWADEAELRRLKRRFRGTTPQGREVMRKLLVRARRNLWGSSPGQIAVQVAEARQGQNPISKTEPI